jgi:hypothetical protein
MDVLKAELERAKQERAKALGNAEQTSGAQSHRGVILFRAP